MSTSKLTLVLKQTFFYWLLQKILQSEIVPSTAGLTFYTKHRITNVGRTIITLHSSSDYQVEDSVWFKLADGDFTPILGLSASVKLSLVKRINYTLRNKGIYCNWETKKYKEPEATWHLLTDCLTQSFNNHVPTKEMKPQNPSTPKRFNKCKSNYKRRN